MRDDHVLLENGQPFFPFGFYNVSWTIPAEERLAMVRDVAKWGYNAVHVGMRNDEYDGDGYGAFLDECAKLGIRVITEFDIGRAESVIRKYCGKAAVMGWNPGDEPAPKGITPQEMFRRYDTFKQIDPDHIAYSPMGLSFCRGMMGPSKEVFIIQEERTWNREKWKIWRKLNS